MQPVVYAYDQEGRLVSMKSFRVAGQKIEDDPMTRQDGDETLWSYDEATGLLLSKTYPDLHQELYGYDTMNRLTSKTQARQVDDQGTPLITTYVYDELSGRLLQVNHNDGTASTQYSYDHLGALTQASSSALDYQFDYDAQGRLSIQRSQGLGSHQLHYHYDTLNRLNSYALNYGGAQVLESQLGYDLWGRLGEVRLNGAAQAFAYHYDAQGGYLKSMSYPHGLQKDITLEAQRDLPVAITYKKATDASFRWGNEYQFDALGRPINKKDYLNATQANLIHHYTHNDRHELISDAMSDGRVCAYDYDNIGNRKNAQEGNDFHRTYQTNELNQYVQGTQANGATFAPQYDADGNQTLTLSDTGVWHVRYNALNQAVCFTKQADASTEISVRIECEYDHMGRRVSKKVFEGGSMVSFKRYLYAGYLQIAELDAMVVATDEQAHPVLRKTYLWDPMHSEATRLLAMSRFDASGVKEEDLYYAQDMLKNTIALLDAQGASRALYEYDPYGKVIKMQGDLARENPFRHSCEYDDDETGLIYYNYRYYNTQDGRWINRDPIAEQGGVNLYAYVGNGVSWLGDELGLYVETRHIIEFIFNSEARRDKNGNVKIYSPPKGDGGGKYEYAGINERFHRQEVNILKQLVGEGKWAEAEEEAKRYLEEYTNAAVSWMDNLWEDCDKLICCQLGDSVGHVLTAIEALLRDTAFNRGISGAINRFQRSLNKTIETSSLVIDGRIGPKVKKAFCELLCNHSESIINEFIDTFSKTTLSMEKNRPDLEKGIRKRINNRASFSKSILISNNPAHDTI